MRFHIIPFFCYLPPYPRYSIVRPTTPSNMIPAGPKSPQVERNLSYPPTWVTIWHPQYTHHDPPLALISLSAYDICSAAGQADETSKRFGIDHTLALDACRIISGNKDGFLSESCEKEGYVGPNEAVPTKPNYYYFRDDYNASDPYPIVTTFEAWSFPDALPPHWSRFPSSPCLVCAASRSTMSDTVMG